MYDTLELIGSRPVDVCKAARCHGPIHSLNLHQVQSAG